MRGAFEPCVVDLPKERGYVKSENATKLTPVFMSKMEVKLENSSKYPLFYHLYTKIDRYS